MLFETLSQPRVFALLFAIGFLSGFVFDATNYIVFLCNKNKTAKIVFDFFATLICFAVFFLATLKFDYGNIRLFHIFAFVLPLALQRKTLGNVIAKLFDWCYNLFKSILQKTLKGLRKKKDDEKHPSKQPNKTF